MKINISDLKKAIKWIEANSSNAHVTVYTGEANKLSIRCMDRLDSEIELTLFESDTAMMPKIKKTEILR